MVLRGILASLFHNHQLLRILADGDGIAYAHLEGRNVHLAAIHFDMPVTNHLASLTATDRESKTESHIVQTALKLLDEQFAGDASGLVGLLVVGAELGLEREVDALGLLLFAQLQAVAYDLGLAALAMLAGSEIALLERALVAETLGAFEEKLGAFATAKAAYGAGVTCHCFSNFGCRSLYTLVALRRDPVVKEIKSQRSAPQN